MKYFWDYINGKNLSTTNKHNLFLLATTLSFSAIGFILWIALRFVFSAINEISWAICFAGYPGFFLGFVGGILFLFQHKN